MNSKNSAEIQVYSYSKHKLKRRISPSHADATEILRHYVPLNDIFLSFHLLLRPIHQIKRFRGTGKGSVKPTEVIG